jgi:hypothetical protein
MRHVDQANVRLPEKLLSLNSRVAQGTSRKDPVALDPTSKRNSGTRDCEERLLVDHRLSVEENLDNCVQSEGG